MAKQLELIPLHPVASPFLKWAGGKTQLLKQFERLFPPKFERYIEPFVGGGAVFFHLFSFGRIREARLSDNNEELINCYRAIRDDPEAVIEHLRKLKNSKAAYLRVRASAPRTAVSQAARTVYVPSWIETPDAPADSHLSKCRMPTRRTRRFRT